MNVFEQILKEEKASLNKKKVELIVEKNGKIGLSEDVKWTELKQEVGEEKDVSVQETEISLAEEFKPLKVLNLAKRQS